MDSKDSLNFTRDNNIFIYGDFDNSISQHVIPSFIKIIKEKKNNIIDFYINSCGGYTNILKELLGLIELARNDNIIIRTFVFGIAYSCDDTKELNIILILSENYILNMRMSKIWMKW